MSDEQAVRTGRGSRRHYVWLAIAACLAAFLGRLVYLTRFVGLQSPPVNDGIYYHLLAQSLAAGNGYAFDAGPTAFRPPGYALFLAGLYSLFGAAPAVARLANLFAGTMLVAMTWALARSLHCSWRVASLSAWVVAIHPVLIYLDTHALAETVSGLLTVTMLWTMVSRSRRLTPGTAVVLSLLLAALVMTRPANILYAPLVALWALFTSDKGRAVTNLIALAAVPAIVLTAWTARNFAQFDAFIPLSTGGGVTFWGGNNAHSNGGTVAPSAETWPGEDPPADLAGWPGLTEKANDERFYAAASDWIRSHPGDWLALLPKKIARTWALAYGDQAKSQPVPGWVSLVYLLFPALTLAGLVLTVNDWRRMLPIYLPILSSMAAVVAFYGSARQSAPLIPAAAVLAAIATDWVLVHVRTLALSRRRN